MMDWRIWMCDILSIMNDVFIFPRRQEKSGPEDGVVNGAKRTIKAEAELETEKINRDKITARIWAILAQVTATSEKTGIRN